jgi:hypothetical protein
MISVSQSLLLSALLALPERVASVSLSNLPVALEVLLPVVVFAFPPRYLSVARALSSMVSDVSLARPKSVILFTPALLSVHLGSLLWVVAKTYFLNPPNVSVVRASTHKLTTFFLLSISLSMIKISMLFQYTLT